MELTSEKDARILVVDDEPGARESLEILLEDFYDVELAEDGVRALAKIRKNHFDLVLLDITMPKCDGIETLRKIKEHEASMEVIMISALDRANEAVTCIKFGAFDYITKPFEAENVLAAVRKVIQGRPPGGLNLRAAACTPFKVGNVEIISQSKKMKEIFDVVYKVAPTASNVLITGESGTGKELIARSLHYGSDRAKKPFVAINCAAIPAELMESELFGHEKGAFTGAHTRAMGKFEFANGGTVFLDEVSSLRIECQAKLLRVLQEREFNRVGSHQPVSVDVRVIAATNTRLDDMVKEKTFRDDLFFRLNVIPISLPPLRHRQGDVSLLAGHFLRKFSSRFKKTLRGITSAALSVLEAYPWPGNVRELENLIERLVVLSTAGQLIDERRFLPFDLLIKEDEPECGALTLASGDIGLLEARQTFE